MSCCWHLDAHSGPSILCEQASPIRRRAASEGTIVDWMSDSVTCTTAISVVARLTFYELDGVIETSGDTNDSSVQWESQAMDQRTTLLIKNLGPACTSETMATCLEERGMVGCFDFIYVPADFNTWSAIGYAIVNWVSHDLATHAMQVLQGLTDLAMDDDIGLLVSWNEPYQGLDVQIARYRNSPVAHEGIPQTYKPLLFCCGVRQVFPKPTARVKAPRFRPNAAISRRR